MYKSQHHTFDIQLAEKYGLEEAILIHHFQHWIQVNQRLKRNFFDGRTWTYQTREEIAAHFPYFTYKQIRKITESLVKQGVLRKGAYNKKGFDKTLWYAFENEEMFTIAQMGNGAAQMGNGAAQMGKPIPDTKTDAEPDVKEASKDASRRDCVAPSEEAFELVDLLVEKIEGNTGKPKKPNKKKWATEIERMHRIDGYSYEEIRELIEFATAEKFWKRVILSPENLRDKRDTLTIRMKSQQPGKVRGRTSGEYDNAW